MPALQQAAGRYLPYLVKHPTLIFTFLISLSALGQIPTGIYRQGDSSHYADLKVYANKTFSFYDSRNQSCWLWGSYSGNWRLKHDTLTLSWISRIEESPSSESASIDTTLNDIRITFKYDNGKPIPKVAVCYTCDWIKDCKYSFTDNNGNVFFPKLGLTDYRNLPCSDTVHRLSYQIKSEFINLSSSGQVSSESNVIIITIKKNLKTATGNETRQFVVKGNSLNYINPDETNIIKNWGNFKFVATKYGR